jgi:uncharacterized protein (TIGR03437 family)
MEQQNPSAANYRKWLTPEEFGNRFGASRDDIEKIVAWLRSQNLNVNDVARGRNWITFSGAAQHVERAFKTEIHWYNVDGELRFSNSADPSLPMGLENIVAGLIGLDDFGLKSFAVKGPRISERPEFTTGDSHYLAPNDLALIYNVAPLHQANIDGSGQKIAVVGATAIDLDDIRIFRSRYNLPANSPQVVLVGPDPGNVGGDLLGEADLDIEWAGAVARNATIVYVYARNVFTAAQYAVDHNLAPVISMSYGVCEPENLPSFRLVAQQANVQGITWIAASGDAGAGGCEQHGVSPQAVKGLAVNFPASMPEITAVGGTEFDEGSGTFWSGSNSSDGDSALSYIPEKAWNDTGAANVLLATGGGTSVLFPKPVWQSGPGVPNNSFRNVPDVAMAAAQHNGYLVYTSGALHSFGGTSAAAPAFAGIVALLNHYRASKGTQPQGGLGNINPALYRLAQTAPGIFHDITTGDNVVPCAQSSPDCGTGSLGYNAGPAYDLTTGLGSVDAYALVTKWDSNSGIPTTTVIAASPGTFPFGNNSIRLTATVTAPASGAAPSGTVTFLTSAGELGTVGFTGSDASLTVSASQLGVGTTTVTALYSGDTVLNGSSGTVTIRVSAPSGSAVIAAISPNPVVQQQLDASGYSWIYTVRLTEQAGIATTLTGFMIDGVDYTSQIVSFFGTNRIPASGTVAALLSARGLKAPVDRVFSFSGADADGRQWSNQLTVRFVDRALVGPALALYGTPNPVSQNLAADPSCRWLQQLSVEEKGGFWVQLTKFMQSSADLTDAMQSVFGATRLAPFGRLQGTICRPAASGPATETFTMTGTTEFGGSVTAMLSASFRTSPNTPAALGVSPQALNILPGAGSATVDLTFSGGSSQWMISVSPANRTTQWLTVSPLSGSGPARLNIQASATGLANGVYSATLVIQAPDAAPQYINVPVTLTVGASSSVSIAGIANAASFKTLFAPGMVMSIFGSQLAPSTQTANTLPLPLTMAGVSVTINGVSAPLYFVSPGQLNVQIPYETGSGPAVLGVNNNGQVTSFPFQVAASAPGIFTAQGSLAPSGSGSPGQTLSMFITGEGDVTQSPGTGATPAAGTAVSKLPRPRLPVTVTVGGVPADVSFVGIPSGLVGVTQINFTVPQSAPAGSQPVIVTIGNAASPPATLSVTP